VNGVAYERTVTSVGSRCLGDNRRTATPGDTQAQTAAGRGAEQTEADAEATYQRPVTSH
jgi:hypothetical protein